MLELNKIYNADCREGLKLLDTGSIDLIVTSPPYNCGIDYDSWDDNLLWDEYLDFNRQWLLEAYRVLKDDGRICVNVLVEMGIERNKKRVSPLVEFYNLMNEIGFNIFGLPMWIDSHRVKYTAWGSWLSASAPYIYNPFEVIIVAYKKQWKKKTKGISTISKDDFMMGASGVWKIKPENRQLTEANFPVRLAKLCIEMFSYKGDIVLDPFMGSGTTAVACLETGRNFIGFEISKEYCQIAERRLGGA